MIHKAAVRRGGHKGCTSAGTDVRVGGTVRARVRRVIDRGGGVHSLQGILIQSWYRKVSPTKDCIKERRQSARSTVVKGDNGEEMERK